MAIDLTRTLCPTCGWDVDIDVDGCCTCCGADSIGDGVNKAHAVRARLAEAEARAEKAERLLAAPLGVTCVGCGDGEPLKCVGSTGPMCDSCCAHQHADGACAPVVGVFAARLATAERERDESRRQRDERYALEQTERAAAKKLADALAATTRERDEAYEAIAWEIGRRCAVRKCTRLATRRGSFANMPLSDVSVCDDHAGALMLGATTYDHADVIRRAEAGRR